MSASSFSLSGWKARIAKEDLSSPDLLEESSFQAILLTEHKRTERSGRRFVLLQMEVAELLSAGNPKRSLTSILQSLTSSIRATDIVGWFKRGAVLGVIFTEVGSADDNSVTQALQDKVAKALSSSLGEAQADQVTISCQVFPEAWDGEGKGRSGGSRLPADPVAASIPRKASKAAKRFVDIAGSLSAIILFAPVMAAIAIAIKLTSKGPVLFKQQRIGHHGRMFSFWKFRSMKVDNNPAIHEQFVKDLIASKNDAAQPKNGGHKVFKITDDPRVTPIGRFIRRTSLLTTCSRLDFTRTANHG